MKIWHITKTIYGGSGQYALRLSNALNDLGHQSTVYVMEGDTPGGVSKLSLISSSTQKFANRCLVSALRRVSKGSYHSGFRLERWSYGNTAMKPELPDAIHLHGMTGWVGFDGLRALIRPNTPVFWTAHDMWMLSGGCVVYQECDRYQTGCHTCPILKVPASAWSHQEWKHKAKFIQDYRIIPIANSQWVADKIRRSALFDHFKDKQIPVIPPIVDSIFFEATSLPCLKQELQISPDQTVVGLSARALTDPYKGIPEFLERFALEESLAEKCTLVLCGDGQIEVPSNLDCRFLGALSDMKELARFYSACDVFVSPSRMETFGMTLLEAQAARTPVVAYHVGGTPEAVCHLKNGYLAENGNYSDFISGIRWVLKHFGCKKQVNSYISTWAKNKFYHSILAAQQFRIYSQFMTDNSEDFNIVDIRNT